jgi:hypothetical protein
MKVKQKKNFTNPGKKAIYAVKTGLGHSKSTGNPDVSPFVGADARVTPDTPNASGTRHSQATREQGASPHRVRKEAGFGLVNHGGTITSNASKE